MPLRLPFRFFKRTDPPRKPAPELTGQCACGAVQYHLAAEPMFVNCCHCRECQRHTGSAFVINGIIETENIKLTSGIVVPFTVPSTSGQPHDIYHCAECQTALWSDYNRRPKLRFMRVGTLDQPSLCPPKAHIYTESKLPWVQIGADIPAYKEYYDMATVWPAQSLERRKAVT